MLTIICSAATEAVRKVVFPADEPLDAQGQAKAAAVGQRLRRIDTAWTSPARRARETAAAMGLAAAVEPALRDVDFGAWSGRSLEAIAAAEPDAVAAWTGDPAAAPHGGESVLDVVGRVGTWLADLRGAEGRVVAVAHPAIVRAAIMLALDAAPQSFWRIDAGPLSSVRLRGRAGRWSLVAVRQAGEAFGGGPDGPGEDWV